MNDIGRFGTTTAREAVEGPCKADRTLLILSIVTDGGPYSIKITRSNVMIRVQMVVMNGQTVCEPIVGRQMEKDA